MCQYIKDNDEQCGRDAEPFCHDHEDTEQAEEWYEENIKNTESGETDVSGDSCVFLDTDDPSICDTCEEPIRRAVASVSEAKFQPKRVVVEEEFRCGCGGVTIGTKTYPKVKVPDGWY